MFILLSILICKIVFFDVDDTFIGVYQNDSYYLRNDFQKFYDLQKNHDVAFITLGMHTISKFENVQFKSNNAPIYEFDDFLDLTLMDLLRRNNDPEADLLAQYELGTWFEHSKYEKEAQNLLQSSELDEEEFDIYDARKKVLKDTYHITNWIRKPVHLVLQHMQMTDEFVIYDDICEGNYDLPYLEYCHKVPKMGHENDDFFTDLVYQITQ
eukprot:NODE_122_length_17689_cov_1.046219.p6 type:complete len:211 gc:universal NODE_122_length_17689_cov_1.046219:14439-13807(-)